MSRNFYSEINLHIVWHTKNSLPLLKPQVEPIAHRCLKKRIVQTPEVFVHEIGGTETHVHLAVTIPPTLTISKFIGLLKGGCSHDVNQQVGCRDKTLPWQTGYELRHGRSGLGDRLHPQSARPSRQANRAGPIGTDDAA